MGLPALLPALLMGLFSREPPRPLRERAAPRRWLPVVDTDSCSGCGLCLQACEHGCFELVWDFATLVRPEDCEGEGRCADDCREDVIRMGWVSQPSGRPAGAPGEHCPPLAPSSPPEDPARSLLAEMLTRVRHSRDTPLDCRIDAPGITAAALEGFADGPRLEDPHRLLASVDRIAREALECRDVPDLPSGVGEGLSSWLERAHRRMSAVHPLAPDILSWRVEGETSREIAGRLGLGLRLTERITADMRAAWTAAAEP